MSKLSQAIAHGATLIQVDGNFETIKARLLDQLELQLEELEATTVDWCRCPLVMLPPRSRGELG